MVEAFVVSLVVGVVEVAPGICRMDLLNPDGTINSSRVSCDMIVSGYEPVTPSVE